MTYVRFIYNLRFAFLRYCPIEQLPIAVPTAGLLCAFVFFMTIATAVAVVAATAAAGTSRPAIGAADVGNKSGSSESRGVV